MKEVTERAKRKVHEDAMEIESRITTDLFIKGVTNKEYDRFIKFIQDKSPRRKGWEAITILLDAYEQVKSVDKIVEYNDELQEKNTKLQERVAELENKEVKEKKKYIGGDV